MGNHTSLTVEKVILKAKDEWAEKAINELGLEHMFGTSLHPRTAEAIQKAVDEHAEYLFEKQISD